MALTPAIKATFDLDNDGQPQLVQDGDLKHYKIRLTVDGVPDDTYAVTYLLDDTYRDRAREARDRHNGFAEELTSYGDYIVQAKIRAKDGVIALSTPLSSALARGHATAITPAIANALDELRSK